MITNVSAKDTNMTDEVYVSDLNQVNNNSVNKLSTTVIDDNNSISVYENDGVLKSNNN